MSKKDETFEEVTTTNNATPLDDEFDVIECDDMEQAYEDLKMKPVPKGEYMLEIDDYQVFKSGPDSKKPGSPLVKFKCKIVNDSNVENNGRKVQSRPYPLTGMGFKFFMDFAKIVTPKRFTSNPGQILGKDGRSKYLDSFVGCRFIQALVPNVNRETGEETGFNDFEEKTNAKSI